MYAPIAIFTYNRLDHFRQTIRHLLFNKEVGESDLYIFSDGARHDEDKGIVEEIRAFASEIEGFRQVTLIPSEKNIGLKASIQNGVSYILSMYDCIIVMEDDICVNDDFLNFHNQCLMLYYSNQKIWSISGFVIPNMGKDIYLRTKEQYFVAQRASSWGWSTWKDCWEKVIWDEHTLFAYLKKEGNYRRYYRTGGDKVRMLLDRFEKKNDSWAIIWDFNHFMNGTYCLYPYKSFVMNIGLDYTGVHSKPKEEYNVKLENWGFDRKKLPKWPKFRPYARNKFEVLNRKFYRDLIDLLRYQLLKMKM